MREIDMGTDHEWENDGLRVGHLAEQLNSGQIGLVLGSGVSAAFGLPLWADLIGRMYLSQGETAPASDPMRAAEYFQSKHCGGDHQRFMLAVQSALYAGSDTSFAALRHNDLLGALGALAMTSVRGSASTVVTFNLDDLLEVYLEYHGFVVNVMDARLGWARRSDALVLHVHGVLPSQRTRHLSDKITLDQHSFSGLVGDDANPLRQFVLTIMRARTCLFVGLSGDDQHLDSLLVRANETHAKLKTGTKYWGVWFAKDPDDMHIRQWAARGVYTHRLKSYDELPAVLFQVCQEAAKLRV